MNRFAISLVIALAAIETSNARAQWTANCLRPLPQWSDSVAWAASGNQQAGSTVDIARHACTWNGTAESIVDLGGDIFETSEVLATHHGRQGGYVVGLWDSVPRATLWAGTAASRVSLHPEGATDSYVLAVHHDQQGGSCRIAGIFRAGIWNGTANSWVDIHPAGATESVVFEIDEFDRQAGYASFSGREHAGFWTGTSDSWVDLNPPGATYSRVTALSSGRQFGFAVINVVKRAGMWSGTADSWVDLHPAGAMLSEIRDAEGGFQVGIVQFGDNDYHASLWSGTAESWVDLNEFMPPGYSHGRALAVSNDGINTYVTGFASNLSMHTQEAMVWKRPCLANFNGDDANDFFDYLDFVEALSQSDPSADLNRDGVIDFFDYLSFVQAFSSGC